jgi:hypothetical protein
MKISGCSQRQLCFLTIAHSTCNSAPGGGSAVCVTFKPLLARTGTLAILTRHLRPPIKFLLAGLGLCE